MSKSSDAVKRWRKGLKLSLIAGFDNKCQICGYDRCVRALELHHLVAEEKNFGFGFVLAHCRNWELICEEAHKCALLCSNCHAEVHDGVTPIPSGILGFNQERAENKKRELLGNGTRKKRLENPLERSREREKKFYKKERHKKSDQIKNLPYSLGEKIKKVKNSGIDFSKIGWADDVAPIIGVQKNRVHEWMKERMPAFYEDCFRHTSYENRGREIEEKKKSLLSSDIDFLKFGWVTKSAPILDVPPQKVNYWMKRNMPEFYKNFCFKKKSSSDLENKNIVVKIKEKKLKCSPEKAITLHQQGFSDREIAKDLGVHHSTVQRYLGRSYHKNKKRRSQNLD